MKDLAPNITRQRLLIEGFYKIDVGEEAIKKYYKTLTKALGLRTYGPPIIHNPSGQGKEINQGYDCFVPLIDSGIYVGAWTNDKFFSPVTTAVYGDKTAIFIWSEPYFVILIKDKGTAKAFNSYFDVLWEVAK